MNRTGSSWVVFIAMLAAIPLVVHAQRRIESRAERFAEPSAARVAREQAAWPRVSMVPPADVLLEASAVQLLPSKRLLVTTRRGELWFVDGAYDDPPALRCTLFAEGLHEPLGVSHCPDGGFYVVQRQELTRLVDRDGDGRADLFQTVCRLPVSGNYHEFAFGPFPAPNGGVRVTLMLAYNAPAYSPVPWRGWMLEIDRAGRITPIAAGFRAGAGAVFSSQGIWLTTENQGEWMGTSHVTQIDPGDFIGHPSSLVWSALPGSPIHLQPDDIPDSGEPIFDLARRIPGIKPPTVCLPYATFGIAPTDIVEDTTNGKFGPYAGHFFVGDSGQSRILRVSLERVRGIWQGAAYAFREGFESGVARLRFGEDGSLFVGETARGWGSVGGKPFAFERVRWSGETPLDIREVRIAPEGFVVTFTRPVDPETAANPASYRVGSFTYQHHSSYGSAPINRWMCPVKRARLSPDLLSVHLEVACLREGYIHELQAAGVRGVGRREELLHDTIYYTLNRLPEGASAGVGSGREAEMCAPPVPPEALLSTARHPTSAPPGWKRPQGDRTILLGTQAGMRFDQAELHASPGEAVQFVFRNQDDMLHNFVLCAPGRGESVGRAALELGLEAAARNYVPDSDDVLFHTAVVMPGAVDRIYFNAPARPGRYDFICSVPGHFMTMKGVLVVD
ncbi:MAG: auracyanin family protein [Opitutaceae bacterium]|nr:auracyanin family protein [Opitutaceae bacterium]